MHKPTGIVYAVDDVPPFGVVVLSALQQAGLMSINLIYIVLVLREVGASPEVTESVMSISLLVLALGAILQALPRGPIGSGFLCQPVPTAVYLVPSLIAAKAGGLPLVFGMTVFAGLVEVTLSRGIRRLRPLFPPEIAGLVVALIGLATGTVALRTILGVGASVVPGTSDAVVTAATLGTMVALNVWTRGGMRLACVLIGMIVGYGLTAILGGFGHADWDTLAATPWMTLPRLDHAGLTFDTSLVIPFGVAAVAATLKVVGNVTTSQKLNDAGWVRADMTSISRGVLADGLTTVIAGAVGTSGMNSATMCVGLANATGVASRQVAYAVGAVLAIIAFCPQLGAVLSIMPRAVAGSALLVAATFIFVNGLEIMTSRLLDVRRTFVIGLSFMGGLGADLFPDAFARFPGWAQPLLVSSIVLGSVVALLLNGIFRLGVRKTQKLVVDPTRIDSAAIEAFMETSGAEWGARKDIIDRASFNLTQSIETIVEGCAPQGALEVAASFDEFNLDLRVSYVGPPLELPEKRPSNEEIMASEEGQRRLAGFMLRRYADRVHSSHRVGRSTILFHFDH
jgi:xanthine permease XanP